jgi:zinc transport system substrate-binding protein
VTVVAAFYPLAYVAAQVGGPDVTVVNLTKPGAEPHDLELTPGEVAGVGAGQVVVYLKGFQPAVDEAIATQARDKAMDVGPAASLRPAPGGGTTGATDPHFWLDPMRQAAVGDAVAARLGEVDPIRRATYLQRAQAFRALMGDLNAQYTTGLASCASRVLVTSHTAFTYLATAYGFTQVGISGLSPDAEPTPAALAALADQVRASKVTTVYTETLVSPALAQTVATEAGVAVAVLDPIEGLTGASAGKDYREVMQSNLTVLRRGQQCR